MYKIGDRVRVNGRFDGEIVDKMQSERLGKTVYRIIFYGKDEESNYFYPGEDKEANSFYTEENLQPFDKTEYCFDYEEAEGVVIVRLMEVDGDTEREIARGHGHVIHAGMLGFVQA